MTDPLGLTPDGLRTTAADLGDVSSRVNQVLSSLFGKLDAEGSPWGEDSMGHSFANGPNGYLAQVDFVKQAIGAKTDLLDGYSSGLKTAADTLQQGDQS
jgi:uncharacterized protein YukE